MTGVNAQAPKKIRAKFCIVAPTRVGGFCPQEEVNGDTKGFCR